MEVKAEVQMQNEVVFLFGRSLAFHCSYYDSFFWLTLHDRLECQILVKTAVFNIPVAFYSRVRRSFYQ